MHKSKLFYEHYQDINDLMIKTEANLSKQIEKLFETVPFFYKDTFTKMFEFIKENCDFYNAYLTNNEGSIMGQTDFKAFFTKFTKNSSARMEFSESELIYHMAFFGAGLSALCKVWLQTGMKETPQQMAEIIEKEYKNKVKFF